MRVSPFGLSPNQFKAAVLNLGPQRLRDGEGPGTLLVIMAVNEMEGFYVALPDDTYVPVLIKFNDSTAAEPFEMAIITSQPGTPFTLSNPRLIPLDNLAQRLAEQAITNGVDVGTLAQSAVDLWFNAGLIDVETAATATIEFAGRYHWVNEWVFDELDTYAGSDNFELRALVARVVREVAEKMVEGYGYAQSST